MALEKLTEDVSVHQTLGDEPNAENGLTGDDLKKLFDRPAEIIKAFINEKLIPFVVDKRGDTMTGNLAVPAPTKAAHAANKGYVDSRFHFNSEDDPPANPKEGDLWFIEEEE